jgi:hypothetical protein
MNRFLGILFMTIIIIGCGNTPSNKDLKEIDNKDSINNSEISRQRNRESVVKDAMLDSIRLAKVFDAAIAKSYSIIDDDKAYEKYETLTYDSAFQVTVELSVGHFFSNNRKHLMIKRSSILGIYFDIFRIDDGKLEKLLCYEIWSLNYMADTIMDINGDYQKDFLVNWYASSGCCLRSAYTAYLYKSEIDSFIGNYEFINPTFSPKDKIIRGVEYGHPGEVPLYKYRWNNLQIDTIEYIYPDISDTNDPKLFRINTSPYDLRNPSKIRIKTVPNEYKKIEGYDWFLMY